MEMYEKKGGVFPVLFLFSVFLLSIFKIKSYDLWWHIKAGELAVGAGFKPAPTNIFSWTEPSHPWVNFSWLFDVIVYLIHKTAGFNGLIIFQAALVTVVFFFVYKTVSLNPHPSPLPEGEGQGEGLLLIFSLFLIAYFAARFRFSLRPHLLALLFFAIDVYILNRLSAVEIRQSASPLSLWERPSISSLSFWERGRVRVPLILIPLLQILWVNIHGSAILGVLLPGIFAIGDIVGRAVPANQRQSVGTAHPTKTAHRFIFIFFLTLAASLVNPYGYKVLTDPFAPFFGQGADLFNTLTVDEWQMPDKGMFLGWYGLLLAIGTFSFLPYFLSRWERISISSLSLWERVRVRAGYTDLILFSSFALLSIKAVRFIDLFAVAAVPVIYRNITGRVGCAHRRILIFSILALFWFIGIKDTTFTLGLGVDNEVIPKKAVDFMENNRVEGRIFHSYNSGGYLIYKGYHVFMDGRLCYSSAIVKEFADANMTASGWKEVEGKYRPEIVMIEYDKPAIPETLIRDKQNWALVYWDDLTMLFLRRDVRFSGIIAKNEYSYLNPMNMYGYLPSSSSPHPSPLPEGEGAKGAEIQSFPLPMGEGQGEGKIFTEAQRRMKDGPESMRAHLLLGNLYLTNKEPDKAALEYASVLDSPATFGKAEAHNNLGTAYERLGDEFEAEKEYQAAIRLDSVYPLPQKNLGYLELGQTRNIEALWHLNRYLHLEEGEKETQGLVYNLKRYRDVLLLRIFIGGLAILGIMWVVVRRFNKQFPSSRGKTG